MPCPECGAHLVGISFEPEPASKDSSDDTYICKNGHDIDKSSWEER